MTRLKKLAKLGLYVLVLRVLVSWSTKIARLPTSILQYVGFGELMREDGVNVLDAEHPVLDDHQTWIGENGLYQADFDAQFNTRNLSMAVVMSKMKGDPIYWLDCPELQHVAQFVYSPEGESGYRRIPRNKGREAMTYLTYMIDEYHHLADISVFMHPHRYAYHQPALLNDSVEILQRLNPARVWSQGYMNLRCQTDPGCPAHIRPGKAFEDPQKKEEVLMAKAFAELFPGERIPLVLAQPCCGQFALSRKAIRAVPREELIHYRQWLLDVKIRDSMSGRILEFLWQYIFLREPVSCPDQLTCYCKGYGLCFQDDQELNQCLKMVKEQGELRSWIENSQILINVTAADVAVWEAQLAERNGLVARIKSGALQRAFE